jgi:hypothetical protein
VGWGAIDAADESKMDQMMDEALTRLGMPFRIPRSRGEPASSSRTLPHPSS